MSRPKYKELYLKEKNKTNELKKVLKQYRATFPKLIGKKITYFGSMRSEYSFDDLDVITAITNRNYYKYVIVRERVEELERGKE